MDTNPFLAILLYTVGGFTGASFYLPFKRVRNWAWESYWMVYTIVALLVVPWAMAFAFSPNVLSVLGRTPWERLGLCFLFGAMWGAGGLTWGLMIRYLGVGLGVSVGCGLCAAVGTLVPPLFLGEYAKLIELPGGGRALAVLLAGVAVSLVGIVVIGGAGMSKESEVSEEQKKASVAEFNFKKGILVAIFSGVMSAGMSFGISMGGVGEKLSMSQLAIDIEPKTPATWQGLPVLVVVMLGGFAVNFIWCLLLNFKNRTTGDYLKANSPLVLNVLFSSAAGALWYSQMALLTTGNAYIGDYKFSSWSVFMSAQIIFSTLWGIALAEWKGVSQRTRRLLFSGLAILIFSVIVIGVGNYLQEESKKRAESSRSAAVSASCCEPSVWSDREPA